MDITTPPTFAEALAARRALIDDCDREILALLQNRTRIVEEVAVLKQKQNLSVFMKPGREARIIRTLLATGTDTLPPRLVVQLWREIMMASLQLEQAFAVVAVVPPAGGMACWQQARDHFGGMTPLAAVATPADAVAAVEAGQALLAVLPDPLTDWWPLLLHCKKPLGFVFRLPFLGGALGDAVGGQGAWVVGPVPAEDSGSDWTFLFFNELYDISHLQYDLDAPILAHWPYATGMLVAVDGAILPDDPRYVALQNVRHLGVVAVPVG